MQSDFQNFYTDGTDSIKEHGYARTIGYAWGTIQTPAQERTSALLVKRIIKYSDSFFINSGWQPDNYVLHSCLVSYQWYSPGSGNFLFKIDSFARDRHPASAGYEIRVGAGYQPKFPLNSPTQRLTQAEVRIAPNPARNFVRVSIFGQRPGTYEIQVYNAIGERVMSKTATTGKSELETVLDISDLPPNLYFISLHREGFYSMHKLQVE